MSGIYFNILVIFSAIMAFLLTCIALQGVGKSIDSRAKRMDYVAQKDSEQQVYEELNQSLFDRMFLPKISKLFSYLSDAFPLLFGNDKTNAELERQLRLAGMHMGANQYNVGKTVFMVAAVIVTIIVAIVLKGLGAMAVLIIVCIGLVLAILLPKSYLSSKVRKRQDAIRDSLPDVIDLLTVSITAGLSFDAGVQKVTEKMSGPFIDELKIMHVELQMGRTRREALKNLARCSDLNELKTFVSAVIQADQAGIPIKNILDVQSKQLRMNRMMRAKEKGQKAPVKMLLPMVGFIFPTLFIVILGPSILNIMKNLG